MDGGTFTISNGGVFGSLMGTPIINPPQSAILGLHAINDRPVAVNGQVRNASFLPVVLSSEQRNVASSEITDHRKTRNICRRKAVLLHWAL